MGTREDPPPKCSPPDEAGQQLPRPDDAYLTRQSADEAVAEYWNRFEAVRGAFADQHQIL